MSNQAQLWGGRFQDATDADFARFNRSFGFDRRLFAADVAASKAYADALGDAGVLSFDEAQAINHALDELKSEYDLRGDDFFNELIDAEDVHSFIEARLVARIGDAGKRLHTGRSRNDQVATAMRLWTRAAIDETTLLIKELQAQLIKSAEQDCEAVMPGYTHLQRAQPVLWAHWCLAYVEMLERDATRFKHARRSANVSPFGCGALAGTSQPVDRAALARRLAFDDAARNSLDAVSDRDFLLDATHACALVMMHLSRLAEDVILYASGEFGFLELGDRIATGSSLMPQKKNPDAMELVRGKTGRVFGHHAALLTLLKGLPLAYNKDLQEDKEAAFDAFDTVQAALRVTAIVLDNLKLNTARMHAAATRGLMNATELADYLVRQGIAFRTAHEVAGRIVLEAVQRDCEINQLALEDLQRIAPTITADVFETLSLESTLASKNQIGGTSPGRVREALEAAKNNLKSSS